MSIRKKRETINTVHKRNEAGFKFCDTELGNIAEFLVKTIKESLVINSNNNTLQPITSYQN